MAAAALVGRVRFISVILQIRKAVLRHSCRLDFRTVVRVGTCWRLTIPGAGGITAIGPSSSVSWHYEKQAGASLCLN